MTQCFTADLYFVTQFVFHIPISSHQPIIAQISDQQIKFSSEALNTYGCDTGTAAQLIGLFKIIVLQRLFPTGCHQNGSPFPNPTIPNFPLS